MISVEPLTLPQMLSEMDTALAAEIKVQVNKPGTHTAINGKFITELSGQYLYTYDLKDLWEPQDDTPVIITFTAKEITTTITNSTGTTITITTEEPLPDEALRQISLKDDSTQLLKRLREVLKNNNEGEVQLGSKSFGLQSFTSGRHPSLVGFGEKFRPDESQEQAIQISLGSEVTHIIGPPGTGKTSTLAAIAFAHLQEGHTVLIAAHTNIAIDNAVMKLADICKDAGALTDLQEERVIRYGTPQLDERLKSEYGDVHLPTIVKRRIGDLNKQREGFQTSLKQIEAQLKTLNEKKEKNQLEWKTERERSVAQISTHQKELSHLKSVEQQRTATLDAQIYDLNTQIRKTQQCRNEIITHLGKITNEQLDRQRKILQYQNIASQLTHDLDKAQQMSSVTRFLKRVDPNYLAKQLALVEYQLQTDHRSFNELQERKAEKQNLLAMIEERFEYLKMMLQNTIEQKNTPSADIHEIDRIWIVIARHKQYIEHLDIKLKKEQAETEEKELSLKSQIEVTRKQIASIDEQFAGIEKSIVDKARVVATTLCKTYMNSNLRERRFDVVILDEVSMAPLPAVYFAASRANSSVVIIGDPQQLAPICNAKNSKDANTISQAEKLLAEKWLGTDLFTHLNIKIEAVAEGYDKCNSVLLNQQARMHPDISHIAREHIYKGYIKDRQIHTHQDYASVNPLPGKALVLCDTSDASPVSTKPEGRSQINIYHALCTMEITRQVLASLPPLKHKLQLGEFRVGLVTPYRKQADLLQHLILDAGLNALVRAGTVHRFQGLEAEVIIFDTVESPPLSLTSFTSDIWGTEGMRLINVAATRAKHKLIVVANAKHIFAKSQEKSILRLALQEAKASGIITSYDLLGQISRSRIRQKPSYDSNIDLSSQKGKPNNSDHYDIELLNDQTFFDSFLQDIQAAKKHIVIFSPFFSPQRIKQLVPIFLEKWKAGVRVTVITSSSKASDPANREMHAQLKKGGVELRISSGMHEKLVFIDEEIVYRGSLNVLSHIGTTEYMERKKSPNFAKRVRQFMNIDTIVEAPSKWGSNIEIFIHELPSTICSKCGKTMEVKLGKYGAFYGCTGYFSSKCNHTEEVSEEHLKILQCLRNIPCGGCGNQTQVKAHRKDSWLVCAAPTSCGYGQHIIFIRSG